ncbi:MAG: carboxylating nicotinate-nucleotide diphosphorylase [Streptococcaceae bacterium]|jgi:nicotinate-nucleotide pyrophosphorylase (carboxylating)|nr:carboxylating nicotinate-nucleotide diphosphorylase [Streptococcaceae bacterium]
MNLQAQEQIKAFLIEDIGSGDLSADLIFEQDQQSSGVFIAKDDGVIAGLDIAQVVYDALGGQATFLPAVSDGDEIKTGTIIGRATGSIRTLLTGERVILNLMQRMSGIATFTRQAITTLDDPTIKICDTRKTAPGLRYFDKAAVRIGGGVNHRVGLYDGVMLKDNHIAYAGSIAQAVEKVRQQIGQMVKIEVEIETKAQLLEAIAANADIIMFDNRTPEQVAEWTKLVPDHILTEISGGISLANLATYAHTGADYLSLGALTHSVTAFDISFNSNEGEKSNHE